MGADGPKVVAAVDFGTHGTGFAWAVRTPPNDDPRTRRVQFFTRFPGRQLDYPKNLTAILLSAGGGTVAWGHRAHGLWAEALAKGRPTGSATPTPSRRRGRAAARCRACRRWVVSSTSTTGAGSGN
ncbi:hypothetical protein ACFQ51_03305 [Streptomyces kaempferi]